MTMTGPGPPPQPVSMDELMAQINSRLDQVSVGTQTRIPTLGPPQEYFTPERAAPPGFRPFVDGDQWAPGARQKEERAQIQAVLNSIGLFGDDGYTPGVWEERSARAWQTVLEYANASFIQDPMAALGQFAQEYQAKGGRPKEKRAPLVLRYDDPNAVRSVVRESAMRLLGRRLSAGDEERFMSAYQSQMTAYQQAAYQAAEGGGAITEPDLQAMTEAGIERDYSGEVATQRYLDGFEKITQALGPVVARPRLSASGGVS